MATGLRTACRLDQGNLMRIAAEVRNPDSVGAKCEWPTKLNIILESAQQNPFLVIYIMESLLAFMLRKKPKTHFAGDLTEKGGDIETSLRTSAAIRIRFP